MSEPIKELIAELRETAKYVFDSDVRDQMGRSANALSDLQARVAEETAKRVEAVASWEALQALVNMAKANGGEPLLARVAELEGARDAWLWLTGRPNLELSFGSYDEEEDGEWQVHRVSGGRNDREWELVGNGQTAMAAVLVAQVNVSGEAPAALLKAPTHG